MNTDLKNTVISNYRKHTIDDVGNYLDANIKSAFVNKCHQDIINNLLEFSKPASVAYGQRHTGIISDYVLFDKFKAQKGSEDTTNFINSIYKFLNGKTFEQAKKDANDNDKREELENNFISSFRHMHFDDQNKNLIRNENSKQCFIQNGISTWFGVKQKYESGIKKCCDEDFVRNLLRDCDKASLAKMMEYKTEFVKKAFAPNSSEDNIAKLGEKYRYIRNKCSGHQSDAYFAYDDKWNKDEINNFKNVVSEIVRILEINDGDEKSILNLLDRVEKDYSKHAFSINEISEKYGLEEIDAEKILIFLKGNNFYVDDIDNGYVIANDISDFKNCIDADLLHATDLKKFSDIINFEELCEYYNEKDIKIIFEKTGMRVNDEGVYSNRDIKDLALFLLNYKKISEDIDKDNKKVEKIEEDFKKLANIENNLQRRKALLGSNVEFFLKNYECYLDPSLFETHGFSGFFHRKYDNTVIGKGTFFVDKNYLRKVLVKKIEQHQLHVINNPNYDSRYNDIYNLLKECKKDNKISYLDLPTVNEDDNLLINYVKNNKYKRICIFVVDPDEKEAVNNYDKYINNLDIEEYPFFELIKVKRNGERLRYTRVSKEIPTGKEDPRIIEMKNFDIEEIKNRIKAKEIEIKAKDQTISVSNDEGDEALSNGDFLEITSNNKTKQKTGKFEEYNDKAEIKGIDNTKIKRKENFSVEDDVFNANGDRIKLYPEPFSEGGEGAIYGITGNDEMIAKLYIYSDDDTENKLTKGRQEKIEFMVEKAKSIKIPGWTSWPKETLYDSDDKVKRNFIGYTMKKADEGFMTLKESALSITKESVKKQYMTKWNRRNLVQIAKNCARKINDLHDLGIYMGDINAGNFMVDINDSNRLFLVDCDSYQVENYPCTVFVDEYTHPDVLKRIKIKPAFRSEKEENFSLAIMLFSLIMVGTHPYAKNNSANEIEQMKKFDFIYKEDASEAYENAPTGDWMKWKNTPKKLQQMFIKTFSNEIVYSAKEWELAIENYYNYFEKDGYSKDLDIPMTYPDKENTLTFKCPIHGEFNYFDYNHKTEIWKERGIIYQKCPKCKASINRYVNEYGKYAKVTCNECKNVFNIDPWDYYIHSVLNEESSFSCKEKNSQDGNKSNKVTMYKDKDDEKWICFKCKKHLNR